MSDIQDYIEHFIKKHETITAIPPIHVYINRINKRLVFKLEDGYKLKIIKLFGSTKKINRQNKKRRVLVWYNLVDNQYQQKSEALNTFTPSKFYHYLLKVESSNLVFLKTLNTEFDETIITFTDQNGRPLQIEDKVKVGLWPFKKNCATCFIENLLKTMKKAFYFILKALLVLKTFKFSSWIFDHVEKTAN